MMWRWLWLSSYILKIGERKDYERDPTQACCFLIFLAVFCIGFGLWFGKLYWGMLTGTLPAKKRKISLTSNPSTKIGIKDSIIQRSQTGSKTKPFSICPYCGEELNLPKIPNFCPFCREKLK